MKKLDKGGILNINNIKQMRNVELLDRETK
jgi:hypothetical protein